MSAQIPPTPEALARLTPAEQEAFRAATVSVADGQKPPMGVIADLVLTIRRLITEVPQAVATEREPGR